MKANIKTPPLRARLWMSVTEYAKLLNVDMRTVMRWDAGTAKPAGCSAAVVAGLTEALNQHPKQEETLVKFIRQESSVGGIAYILVRLLEMK